jgi:hypothetical protein
MSLARLVNHARQKEQAIRLVLVDPDVIEAANVGRQAFSPGEIGGNKAESMALRLNLALGLDITAVAAPFTADIMSWLYRQHQERHHQGRTRFILVGAVDNYLAQWELAEAVSLGDGHFDKLGAGSLWAVDSGNSRSNGQVLVGNLTDLGRLSIDKLGLCTGLPCATRRRPCFPFATAPPRRGRSAAWRDEQLFLSSYIL